MEHSVRDVGVAGSNPATPTNLPDQQTTLPERNDLCAPGVGRFKNISLIFELSFAHGR